MNFREYFRTKIPGLYFIEGSWLEKIKEILLMPTDIFMQVLDYIPRLRDLKDRNAPSDGLLLEAAMRNMIKYHNEPRFVERLIDSWNIWSNAGSRYGLNKIITFVGYTMDTTTYEYGIQEHVLYVKNAYWADAENVLENRGVVFRKFYWGGAIDSQFCYAIYITDPTESIYGSDTKVLELIQICDKYAPAHCNLAKICFTDGAGTTLNTKVLIGDSWAEA